MPITSIADDAWARQQMGFVPQNMMGGQVVAMPNTYFRLSLCISSVTPSTFQSRQAWCDGGSPGQHGHGRSPRDGLPGCQNHGRADVRDSQAGMGAMPKFGQVVPMMARS